MKFACYPKSHLITAFLGCVSLYLRFCDPSRCHSPHKSGVDVPNIELRTCLLRKEAESTQNQSEAKKKLSSVPAKGIGRKTVHNVPRWLSVLIKAYPVRHALYVMFGL